ncbi:hypothetical protein L873DRAFT_334890 [Choiromyces venosus 120613-1]|uniref:Uncharacterized protein n=1 Tax=Choiromyces venosus 120613-1 TaxID=1336337 RepID=A0A3N4IYJ0_9PEZI|nr:hypothetical protein L873DRAFT_334890 [Choiromyces venosus 120613-1]
MWRSIKSLTPPTAVIASTNGYTTRLMVFFGCYIAIARPIIMYHYNHYSSLNWTWNRTSLPSRSVLLPVPYGDPLHGYWWKSARIWPIGETSEDYQETEVNRRYRSWVTYTNRRLPQVRNSGHLIDGK